MVNYFTSPGNVLNGQSSQNFSTNAPKAVPAWFTPPIANMFFGLAAALDPRHYAGVAGQAMEQGQRQWDVGEMMKVQNYPGYTPQFASPALVNQMWERGMAQENQNIAKENLGLSKQEFGLRQQQAAENKGFREQELALGKSAQDMKQIMDTWNRNMEQKNYNLRQKEAQATELYRDQLIKESQARIAEMGDKGNRAPTIGEAGTFGKLANELLFTVEGSPRIHTPESGEAAIRDILNYGIAARQPKPVIDDYVNRIRKQIKYPESSPEVEAFLQKMGIATGNSGAYMGSITSPQNFDPGELIPSDSWLSSIANWFTPNGNTMPISSMGLGEESWWAAPNENAPESSTTTNLSPVMQATDKITGKRIRLRKDLKTGKFYRLKDNE